MSNKLRQEELQLFTNKHPFRQWKTWKIPQTDWTITGYSRSNDKTFFHIPQLNCCIDAALCEGRQPEHVLLTHTHSDHSADIEYLASRDGGASIYTPERAASYVDAYIRAKRELNHNAAFRPELMDSIHIHGVKSGDTFSIGKKKEIEVEVFECIHKVPCVGFGFSQQKTRLKEEFQVKKDELFAQNKQKEFGQWMASLHKDGVETKESYTQPLLAVLGDTHANVFDSTPSLFRYPVIMTECTFLDDQERERAEQNGHTLWSQLRPIVKAHPETLFMLTHFSLRHSDREVVAFFDQERQEHGLNNVMVWAHAESLLPELHQAHSK